MDDQGDGTGMRLFFHRERISDRGLEPCFRRPRTTVGRGYAPDNRTAQRRQHALRPWPEALPFKGRFGRMGFPTAAARSEEHTSELQSLMRISYAVFCLKKKKRNEQTHII